VITSARKKEKETEKERGREGGERERGERERESCREHTSELVMELRGAAAEAVSFGNGSANLMRAKH
jgi:hypothetical protein